MDRRKFLGSSALITAGMAADGCAGKSTSKTCPAVSPVFNSKKADPALADLTGGKRPNILFVLTDQERWYGNLPSTLSRPHLSRLRENSVSFENTFCAYPLCSPSRSAIFSGTYPHQNGVTHNCIFPAGESPLDPNSAHIGSVLASSGYEVGYKGKWDLSRGPTYYTMNLSDRGRAGEYGYKGHCGDVPDQEYAYLADEQVVDESCEWIKTRNNDRPWFLTCSIIDPHDICHPQLKPDDSVRPDVVLPKSLRDDLLTKPSDQKLMRDGKLSHFNNLVHPNVKPTHKYNDHDWKLFLSYYYDLIEGTDQHIGRLFKALEESDMLENTVIVYTSDHGELGGAHGFSGKYEGYEEDLHVPLLYYHPSLEKNEVSTLTSNISIAPTVASLGGTSWPVNISGTDMSGWINNKGGPSLDAVFSETQVHVNAGVYKRTQATRMIRTDMWKYSFSFYDVKDGQLYDLSKDPHEMNNLFHDLGHKAIRKELEQRLFAWQNETKDNFRVPVSI
jgi:arylsulfatase A-like enzyme